MMLTHMKSMKLGCKLLISIDLPVINDGISAYDNVESQEYLCGEVQTDTNDVNYHVITYSKQLLNDQQSYLC